MLQLFNVPRHRNWQLRVGFDLAGEPVSHVGHHEDPESKSEGEKRKRSEEHTSELQSRPHLVCRLLLEKKNAVVVQHRLPATDSTRTVTCVTDLASSDVSC